MKLQTGKISGFLIIVFSVLSILFYSLYISEAKKSQTLSEDFISLGIENLSSRNVSVDPETIIREIPDKDVFVIENVDFLSNNNAVANVFVEEVFDKKLITTMSFEMPTGVSLVIHDKSDSSKELARVIYSDKDFGIKFSKNGVTITGTDIPAFNNRQNELSSQIVDKITSITQKIVSQDTSFRISGVIGEDDFYIVTVVKTVDEIDLKDVFINYVFQDGNLVAVGGNWFLSTPKARYHNTLKDGLNVLYMLDFDNLSTIKQERIVYSLQKVEDNRYFLLPVWEIVYLDNEGNQKTAYFDAI